PRVTLSRYSVRARKAASLGTRSSPSRSCRTFSSSPRRERSSISVLASAVASRIATVPTFWSIVVPMSAPHQVERRLPSQRSGSRLPPRHSVQNGKRAVPPLLARDGARQGQAVVGVHTGVLHRTGDAHVDLPAVH